MNESLHLRVAKFWIQNGGLVGCGCGFVVNKARDYSTKSVNQFVLYLRVRLKEAK